MLDFQKYKADLESLGIEFVKFRKPNGEIIDLPTAYIDPQPSKIIKKVRVWRLSSEVDGFDGFIGTYIEFCKFCKTKGIGRKSDT